MLEVQYKSPLHQTISTTPTDFWNDSCAVSELEYAIEHGAVGATSNPTIVEQVLKLERDLWVERIHQLIADNPTWTDEDVMWQVFEEIGVKGAEQLLPVFEREHGRKGRLSIQTNPANYRNAERMVEQAVYFSKLAPNMQVKLPVTSQGIKAIEEATYHGVNINATVSFTVPQAVAVGEAVDRGLARREAEGLPVDDMSPVCTIMVGHTDDWMGVVTKRDGITVNPAYLPWAGVAVFKKAYEIFQERGFKARLLAAAYRHHLHWSEFIGADVNADDSVEVAEALQHLRGGGQGADARACGSGDRRRSSTTGSRTSASAYDVRWHDDRGVRHVRGNGAYVARLHCLLPRVDQSHQGGLHAPKPGREVALKGI